MALDAAARSSITKLVTGMLGTAPGTYMDLLENAYTSMNGDMTQFASALAQTPVYQSARFAAGASGNDFAEKFLTQNFSVKGQSLISDANKAWAHEWMTNRLAEVGGDQGQVMAEVLGALSNVPADSADWGSARQTFDNRNAVAEAITDALEKSGNHDSETSLLLVKAMMEQVGAETPTEFLGEAYLDKMVSFVALAEEKSDLFNAMLADNGDFGDLLDAMPAGADLTDLLDFSSNLLEKAASAADIEKLFPEGGDLSDYFDSLGDNFSVDDLISAIENGDLGDLGDLGDGGNTDNTGGAGGGGGGSSGGGGADPEFSALIDAGVVTFENAGDTITAAVDGTDVTFTSDGTDADPIAAANITEIVVDDGITLAVSAAIVGGNTTVSGAGDVTVSGADTTLTLAVHSTGTVTVEGTGGAAMTGNDDDQILVVNTTGTNQISGGKGVDSITLGDGTGADVVVVGGTQAPQTETHELTFQNLIAGQSVTVDGLTLTASDAIAAADVATAFAGLAASADGAGVTVTNGTWSGALSAGWSSGTATGAAVTFTSETADSNVTDIVVSSAGIAAPTAVGTSATQGDAGTAATTESYELTFQDLIAGQSVTVDGLTLTATGNISAADVAAGFASLDNTAATAGAAVTDGVWSGAKSTAWTSGTAAGARVTFTSETANTDVTDIVVSSAGVDAISAPTAVGTSATQGDVSTTESYELTFQDLAAGQSVTVDGLTLTASDAIAAADVATAFAGLAASADGTGVTVTNGTWSGALSAGWSSGTATDAVVTFTSETANTDVTDIVVSSAGVDAIAAPTAVGTSATQGDAGTAATTESYELTFQDLIAGQSVTVDGLTLTATGNISAADVAAGFASLDNTAATAGAAVTDGVWSGAKSTAWTSGTAAGAVVTFTSETANTDVTDIVVSSAGVDAISAPTAVGTSATQGDVSTTESYELTFQDLAAGQSVTVDGLTLTASDAIAAADVATAFAGLAASADGTGVTVTNGTWSGALSAGWSSGTATDAVVTFTSETANTDVTDIVVSSAGVDAIAAPTAVGTSATQGDAGTAATTESYELTFQDLIAGQSVTVDGLTLTATGNISAADVAAGFASLDNTAATAGAAVTDGVWSGAKSTAWTSGTAAGAVVTFTSETANTDVTDIVVSSAGVDAISAPTAVGTSATQGDAGTTATTENHELTFQDLIAGQFVTVDGLTLTATGNISAADVAAGFASLDNTAATAGAAVTDGVWSGAKSTAWTSGTAAGAVVTFTSETANTDVTDIVVSSAGVDAPTAVSDTATQGRSGDTVSDSYITTSGNHFDTITHFDTTADKLLLPTSTLATGTDLTTGVTDVTASVTDGIITFVTANSATEPTDLADIATALFTALDTSTAAAAFSDGTDTYVLVGDGTAGLQDTDIVIKLAGVNDLTDLSGILASVTP